MILFIVDASGSMAARRRMEAVKGAVLSLLRDAYERHDWVGVIAFRGVPGTPYITAWANSGKSRRKRALRLMAIRQARLNKPEFLGHHT